MEKATIRDVARHAGVGVGTVSRVLNHSTAVSDATRQKVLAAIQELEFAPSAAARRLSRGKSMALGVIVPFFTNPSVVRRLQGIVSVVTASDYDLVLFDIETTEQRDGFLRQVPRRQLADGLLLVSLTPTDEDVAQFERHNLPVVLIDAYHPALSHVRIDNVSGGYTAIQHLLQLGHRRIAYVSDFLDDPFNSPVRDRYQGYRQALADAGIPFRPEYHRQAPHGRDEARRMTADLLDLEHPPTAIFAYSDTQAIGVLEVAQARGLSVPGDLSLIGYDNIEASELMQLTTINQSLFQSGVRGSELILTRMKSVQKAPQEIVLPFELVIRRTTAPPADLKTQLKEVI